MLQKSSDPFADWHSGSPKLRVHAIDADALYAAQGRTLVKLSFTGQPQAFNKFHFDVPDGLFRATELGRRLWRAGIHHVVCFKDKLVIFIDKLVLAISSVDGSIVGSPVALTESRPLAVCNAANEKLYYGEYNGIKKGNSSGIILSEDGIHWTEIYRLRNIRHIHGIYFDPYGKSIWVTTGDADTESGLWVTGDGFKTIERALGGSQQTRAIQLLFTQTHVYFGSDTSLEKNFIYRMDKRTGHVEQLQEVESSVFWGCKVGDSLFFSTAVEPSQVNTSRYAFIWGSQDGEKWRRVAAFRKDLWPMRLFQYGQIHFPTGKNDTGCLFFTPVATEKHGTIQRLKVTDLFGD